MVHVSLGHRRLSIIDLSRAGAQPVIMNEDRSLCAVHAAGDAALVMVYNGEIYNYVELRKELRNLGHRFTSEGDSQVLLAAYAQWGEECLARLNGMFAFAIWDEARRQLFCARDRFGEKPLYYTTDPRRERFAFASEVKALVALGTMSPEPNLRAVYRYFRFGEQAGVPDTVWENVWKLLPGTCLTVKTDRAELVPRLRRYWDVSVADDTSVSTRSAAERFAELFQDSVRIRLRSDVPVGTSLSGGLDSSSVLCQIHALGAAGGQKAFTARMDDPLLDEGRYADVVLRHTGVQGFSVVPRARQFLDELDRLAYHQEEPFTSTSVFASFLVQRLAREHGVTVMLDGQGADEYLAGYPHYPAFVLAAFAKSARWGEWWRERVATRRILGVDPVPPRAALKYWLTTLTKSNGASPEIAVDAERDCSFLRPEVRARFVNEEPRRLRPGGDPLKGRLYADLMHGHLQELLRYADRNSMASSRELRLPFLDHRLVEFTLSLPASMLFHDGWSKRVLRDAMRGVVPAAILDRRDKVGFMAPWAQWWRDERSAAVLRERLRESRALVDDYVNVDMIEAGSPAALGVLSFARSLTQLRALAGSVSSPVQV
jgi:asparagine synthase (glutamine-hydrolysing)